MRNVIAVAVILAVAGSAWAQGAPNAAPQEGKKPGGCRKDRREGSC